MSKLAAIAIVPLLGGTAAVVAWNMTLQDDLDTLRTQVAELQNAEPVADGGGAAKRSRAVERQTPMLQEIQHRLHVIEQQSVNAAPVKALTGGASTAGAAGAEGDEPQLSPEDLPSVYRSGEFTLAVEGVLDAREERRRQERLAKQAEKLTQNALRNLDVTDTQQADFQRLTLDYLKRREGIRRDKNASDEERRQRATSLEEERRTSLASLFDDEQMAQIERRIGRRGGMKGGFGNRVKPARADGQRTKKRRPEKRGGKRRGNDDS